MFGRARRTQAAKISGGLPDSVCWARFAEVGLLNSTCWQLELLFARSPRTFGIAWHQIEDRTHPIEGENAAGFLPRGAGCPSEKNERSCLMPITCLAPMKHLLTLDTGRGTDLAQPCLQHPPQTSRQAASADLLVETEWFP